MTYFNVRRERCASCLYRLKYERRTREAILGEVEANDSYVSCHQHDPAEGVCCRGYYDAVGEAGGTALQLAIRLERLEPGKVIRWVADGELPAPDDDPDTLRDGPEDGQ